MKNIFAFARSVVVLGASVLAFNSLSALTIDTTAAWGGSVNSGWLGSGQSFTITSTDTFFNDLTVYADAQAAGRTFTFKIFDALNGGSLLFDGGSFLVSAGANTVSINQSFTAGSTIFAQFDYNGYYGASLHFQAGTYAGGNSTFGAIGSQVSYSTADHQMIANFSAGPSSVPESGSSLGLLGLVLVGLAALRRRFAR